MSNREEIEKQMQKIFMHADDFGISQHINECIYECFKNGALNSTSIVVNSNYLNNSLNMIRDKKIRKVLHLNIVEGKAVSKQKFSYLTDKEGKFYRSWQRVMLEYYTLSNKAKRELIEKEIKQEYRNQILLYCRKLQTKDISIDSHQHFHVIPFITDILIELKNEIDINILNIRVPKERFFCEISSLRDLKNYLGINFFVHFLLNYLSKKMITKFDRRGINHNDAFIGVLFSGNMTLGAIQKGLEKVQNAKDIEILLHPGSISVEEKAQFKNDEFKRFYVSKNRKTEMKVLLSSKLKGIISGF